MAETNAAVSTKSQEESQKAFKERLLKIMGADATEAYLKAYGFDEGNAFARNYDGTLPAEGEEPAFFTNIDEQGNVLFLDEDRALRKSSFLASAPCIGTSRTAWASSISWSCIPLRASGIGRWS